MTAALSAPAVRRSAPLQLTARVDLAAAGLVVLQAVVLALVALPGSFYLDDLAATSRAAASDLTLGHLLGPDGHHLAPGAMLVYWLQAHLAPLDHSVAVAGTLALQAAATALLWRLLRSLFGPRPLALVPLALYALTPLSVPTDAWWIQSVCLLPVHLAVVVATTQHVAWLRTRRLRHAVGAGLAVAVGLLFWEKAVLAAVLPFLLTLVAFTSGGPLRRARQLLREWPAWLALSVPPVVFALLYARGERQPARGVSAGRVLHLVGDSTTHLVVPSLVGGPWRWTTREYYGVADPTTTAMVVSGALVAGVVVLTVRRRRAALAGWVLLLLYVPLSLAPVAAGRLAQFGLAVGRDSRYLTDVAVAAALALGLALLPLRETADEPRPSTRPRLAGAALLAVALVTSAAVSDVRFAQRWHDNPTGAYLAALTADLDATGGDDALYEQLIPGQVLNGLYAPYDRLSTLVGQLPGSAVFDDGARPLSVVTDDGHVRPGRLEPVVTSGTGASPACGWLVDDAHPSTVVPLQRGVGPFVGRTVRVELLLSVASPLRIRTSEAQVGDGRVLPAGPGAVVAELPGSDVTALTVDGLTPGASACVLSVTVGRPVPLVQP